MLDNQNKVTGFVLTLITLTNSLCECLISMIILCLMIYNIFSSPLRRRDKIILFLCCNIYFWILIYMTILSWTNIQTALGDLYDQDFNSSWCIFIGYISPTILCVLYYSFVNQAFYRLCRIVYFQSRCFQYYPIYVIIPPLQLLLAFIFLSPLLFWHDVIYLPTEYYCYAAFLNFRGILWTALMAYGLPAFCLFIIYMRIIIFMRQQAINQAQTVRRQQARDFIAIQRIIITDGVLIILGVPSVILVITAAITGREYPLSFRIIWISLTVSMSGLCVAMSISIPQLKNIVWKNRVTPTS